MHETNDGAGPDRIRRLSVGLGLVALIAISVAAGAIGALWLDGRNEAETADTTPTTSSSDALPTSTSTTTEAPVPDGPTTFEIDSEDAWYAAVGAAEPGDVLLLTATITSRLEYRGGDHNGRAIGASGTENEPITITALPDVWIDPGDISNNTAALDVRAVDFVVVDAINVRQSQFGIRLIEVGGTERTPSGVVNSTVVSIGHSGIAVQADFDTLAPSGHILISDNSVSETGLTNPRFGEGIYIGIGSVERIYMDESHDITVSGNRIFSVGAEAIDVKPGTRDVVVEDNLLYDLAPIDGGAISAHYASDPNPKPQELDRVTIRRNRIWNQNLDGVPGANDWAIWVGHGGVTIEDNIIWGMRDSADTRAVRVRALADFGPHPIVVRNNIFWTSTGVVAEGEPSGAQNLLSDANVGPVESEGTTAVDPSFFVGSVPAPGAGGDADNGSGPGSGFLLAADEG